MIAYIALLVGILILGAGLYYLAKSKGDKEARTIYTVTAVAGAVMVIAALVKILVMG